MKISKNDREMLWGKSGPYSEAKIVLNVRILDDRVSRVMIEVEANINPTTFKIVKKNIDLFADNPIITQLVANARYMGKQYGYLVSADRPEEFIGPKPLERAQKKLNYTEEAIIIMHKFVMEYLKSEK